MNEKNHNRLQAFRQLSFYVVQVGDISGFINGFNITDINQLMRQYEEYINKGPKN